MSVLKNIIIYVLFIFYIFWISKAYYFEPNSNINDYLNIVRDSFVKLDSYSKVSTNDIPTSIFVKLKDSFSILKNKLPKNPRFQVIYENCYLASQSLATNFDRAKFDTFNAQCFWPWKTISEQIFTKYAVQANIKAYPNKWNAPLTVTFDARSSRDPSSDTIPTSNYYWYYKDSNWLTKLMWEWPVIKYTFNTPNDYIIHLTVRSSNKQSEGILDWSASKTVSVAPPIANLSLYINWQRAYKDSYVKISSKEWKNGVLFNANGTTPAWSTKITSSYWIIRKKNKTIYKTDISDYPWSIRVKLPENWIYFVTLWIKDNTWKKIEQTYKLIVSNPVALIRVSPQSWNTSTNFSIDWSLSYSINWNIDKYRRSIVWPHWSQIDSFENKKNFKYKFTTPWIYAITLEVRDINWNKNAETYKLNVESTPPIANFIYKKYDNWEKPSTFVFDASYSSDVDTPFWDKLTYEWHFSDTNNITKQDIKNGEKAIVQFNRKWIYKVTLIVKDRYWKTNSIEKTIKIDSVLRPKVSINPNYTILWQAISIKVKTNKNVDYYRYIFWDGKDAKTQSSFITHTYNKAWIYDLKVIVFSTDGDSNSITKKVFVWQKGSPIAIYDVYNWSNRQKLASTLCPVKNSWWKWKTFKPAYLVWRMQTFTINASKSVNGKWLNNMLSIYFRKQDSNENILKKNLSIHLDELWCHKIDLYVRDLNTNKIDKKSIYFKVIDVKPVLKWVSMYFPQYWWPQWNTVFKPQVWGNTTSKNLFKWDFDPLLVQLIAKGAYDPDSSVLANYRWYYYREWDKENIISVKETPYNINQAVFSLPKIPWKYIFWVDVCDVDGKCTNSEEYLQSKLIVNIPPDSWNPDIPQVNSVRIDKWNIKWAWEVDVGDEVTIVVNSQIWSHKSDFHSSRTIKYDFDNDGKYDLTTKKDKVKYVFKKPWKYVVKVKVIYRWYWWIGYSKSVIVKKWLKIMLNMIHKWNILLYNDLSFWNISKRYLCFSVRKCKTDPVDFLIKNDQYWAVQYQDIWTKLLYFKINDIYGNEKKLHKKIYINKILTWSFLLTLPKYTKSKWDFYITAAWMYNDYVILYYASNNKNCYIDRNISIDSDSDGDTTNDKDLSCNMAYKLQYPKIPEVSLLVYDGIKKKHIKIIFTSVELSLPSKYKKQYKQLQELIDEYSKTEDNKYLVKMLSDLLNNLDDKWDRESILYQLSKYLDNNDIEWEEKIRALINSLSDENIQSAISWDSTVFNDFKTKIRLLLENDSNEKHIEDLFKQFENNTSKEKRKQVLQEIMNIWIDMKKIGKLTEEELKSIKTYICNIMKVYTIPSNACSTWLNNVKVENSWWSTFWKILKIVLRILATFVIIFIIIVAIFVIKAKRNRQETNEE